MFEEARIAHCRTRIQQEERAALSAGSDAAQHAHAELARLYRRLETALARHATPPAPLADAAVPTSTIAEGDPAGSSAPPA